MEQVVATRVEKPSLEMFEIGTREAPEIERVSMVE